MQMLLRSISGMVFAVEREEVMLYVEVKDPNAPVTFYINNKKLDEGDFRCLSLEEVLKLTQV